MRTLPDLPNISAARPRGASFLNPGFAVLFPRDDTEYHTQLAPSMWTTAQQQHAEPWAAEHLQHQENAVCLQRVQDFTDADSYFSKQSLPSVSRTAEKFALLLQKQEENHILWPVLKSVLASPVQATEGGKENITA